MKLPKSLKAISRAKRILNNLPGDLETAILSQKMEIEIQQRKIQKALTKPLKISERRLLQNYLYDLCNLLGETEKCLNNKSKLNQIKAWNSVININKSMNKKYDDDLITKLAGG